MDNIESITSKYKIGIFHEQVFLAAESLLQCIFAKAQSIAGAGSARQCQRDVDGVQQGKLRQSRAHRCEYAGVLYYLCRKQDRSCPGQIGL